MLELAATQLGSASRSRIAAAPLGVGLALADRRRAALDALVLELAAGAARGRPRA